ncbi:MAG: efflux RND transporter periplasmic adaptor subunit [Thermoanaerobaculia bacterium]|nr:efflux RND transporter periplasmic adaptor subunit [Thermoanaerobaculia bacterium]
MTKIVSVVVGGLLLAVLAASGEDESGDVTVRVRNVRTARVDSAPISEELPFAGVLRAADRADLAFESSGRLDQRSVDVGAWVEKGQSLARLDAATLRNVSLRTRAQLAEAAARLEQLQRDRQRVVELVSEGAATEEELERVGSSLEAGQAVVDAAQTAATEASRREGEAVLVAPFSGRVVDVHFEAGEWVDAGRTVLSIAGQKTLEVVVDVPESVIGILEVGAPVTIRFPFDRGMEMTGRVVRRGLAARGAGRLFPVTVELPPGETDAARRRLPGMSVEAVFQLTTAEELSVPLAAVVNPGGSGARVVRISQQGTAERVEVDPIRLVGDRVVIRGGLNLGDRVVVAGGHGLSDGNQVEVVP